MYRGTGASNQQPRRAPSWKWTLQAWSGLQGYAAPTNSLTTTSWEIQAWTISLATPSWASDWNFASKPHNTHALVLLFPTSSGKESACQCRRHKRRGFGPWVGKISWRRKWQPTPVFLSGECHGQRTLAGYCPGGQTWLSTHTHTHTQICTLCMGLFLGFLSCSIDLYFYFCANTTLFWWL